MPGRWNSPPRTAARDLFLALWVLVGLAVGASGLALGISPFNPSMWSYMVGIGYILACIFRVIVGPLTLK